MIVICEECGKKYRIDPEKIPGKGARFKCKSCHQLITVIKPYENPLEPTIEASHDDHPVSAATAGLREKQSTPKVSEMEDQGTEADEAATSGGVSKGLGLRTKMVLLFLLIPVILLAGASALYLFQLKNLSTLLIDQSSDVIIKMGEDIISESSRAISKQCSIYLKKHSELRKEDFLSNKNFSQIAIQKIGMTGYTALYERPGHDGIWRTWAHINPAIVGIDMTTLKKRMGRNFNGFWQVYSGVKDGKESQGYYTWYNQDGSERKKFMVCTPVEDTPFVVATTTYLDEFSRPVTVMKTRANKVVTNTSYIIFGILLATIVLIGLVVSLYGNKLSGQIKSLTDTAERISVGELDAEIDIKSKDEIGDLGEAIVRMQESIRMSIERLRRRR